MVRPIWPKQLTSCFVSRFGRLVCSQGEVAPMAYVHSVDPDHNSKVGATLSLKCQMCRPIGTQQYEYMLGWMRAYAFPLCRASSELWTFVDCVA